MSNERILISIIDDGTRAKQKIKKLGSSSGVHIYGKGGEEYWYYRRRSVGIQPDTAEMKFPFFISLGSPKKGAPQTHFFSP